MKVLPLVSSLIATVYAAPSPSEAGQLVEWKAEDYAADPVNPLMKSTVNGEKVLPRFSMTKAIDGAKRTVVKHGPYIVSSAKMMSTIKASQGPCPTGGGCYVTAMEATIRYPDGKEANVDTGAWLHHIALFGKGAGSIGIWAAGNERPTLRLNTGGQQFGLDFPAMFMLMIDLMSEDVKPKNLTLEISFEYIPKGGSTKYKPVTMYWLTIGEPQAREGKYSFNTLPSTVSEDGELLYSIGHMHDGGTDMTLYAGGKLVCKSIMHYNAREGYFMKGDAHKRVKRQHAHGGGGKDSATHISDPGACTNFGSVKKYEQLKATANYDANKFKLMVHNGQKEKLMGNMRVYVGVKKTA